MKTHEPNYHVIKIQYLTYLINVDFPKYIALYFGYYNIDFIVLTKTNFIKFITQFYKIFYRILQRHFC